MGQIIQLIDSYTKENVNYEETTVWHDGSVMDDTKVDNVIYRKKENKYYKRIIDTIAYLEWFGCKCDAKFGEDNTYATDDRENVERAISICAPLNIPLTNKGGVVLLNSLSMFEGSAHNGIVEMKSNMHLKNISFTIGDFFNGRSIALFNGFNKLDTYSTIPINNITVENCVFDLDGLNNKMSSYTRRLIFQFGTGENVRIENNIFRNADLSNCIGFGILDKIYNNVIINNNTFKDLATNDKSINIDHSTIYAAANNVVITNNKFLAESGSNVNYVGCAIEQHGSDFIVQNNIVENYARFMYLTAFYNENPHNKNITISNNISKCANSHIYSVTNDGSIIENIQIYSNTFISKHIDSIQLYNGFQSLYIAEDYPGNVKNMKIHDNIFYSEYSRDYTLVVGIIILTNVSDIEIYNNKFGNVNKGIVIEKQSLSTLNVNSLLFKNNNIMLSDINSCVIDIKLVTSITKLYVGKNYIDNKELSINNVAVLINKDVTILNSIVETNYYTFRPKKEYIFKYNSTVKPGAITSRFESIFKGSLNIQNAALQPNQTKSIEVTGFLSPILDPSDSGVVFDSLFSVSDLQFNYLNGNYTIDKEICFTSNGKAFIKVNNLTASVIEVIDSIFTCTVVKNKNNTN